MRAGRGKAKFTGGGGARVTGAEQRAYSSVHGGKKDKEEEAHPNFDCHKCGVRVITPKTEFVADRAGGGTGPPRRLMHAMREGGVNVGRSSKTIQTPEGEEKITGHLVDHPAKIHITKPNTPGYPGRGKKENDIIPLKEDHPEGKKYGPLKVEHIHTKTCPTCHKLHFGPGTILSTGPVSRVESRYRSGKLGEKAEKSLALIEDILSKAEGSAWGTLDSKTLNKFSGRQHSAARHVALNLAVHHSEKDPGTQDRAWSSAKQSQKDAGVYAKPKLVQHYLHHPNIKGRLSPEQHSAAQSMKHARTGEHFPSEGRAGIQATGPAIPIDKSVKSDAWISDKISYLVKEEGKPQKQAVAIAYSMAGKSKKKVKKSLFLRSELLRSDAPVYLRDDLVKGRRIPGLSYGGRGSLAHKYGWGEKHPRCQKEGCSDLAQDIQSHTGGTHTLCHDHLKELSSKDPKNYGWLKKQGIVTGD
jgi:hypothetical protein